MTVTPPNASQPVELYNDGAKVLDFITDDAPEEGRMLFTAKGLTFAAETEHYIAVTATLCAAGRIRNALNKPGPFEFTDEALRQGVQQGQFDNLACFVDHQWVPSMRELLGTWQRASYQNQQVRNTLHIYKTAANQSVIDTLHAIKAEKEAGNAIPDVGISIVCFPEIEASASDSDVRRITAFNLVESADLVFMPAVTTARIDMSSKQGETATMSKQADTLEKDTAVDNTAPAPTVTADPVTPVATQPATPVKAAAADTSELDAELARIKQMSESARQWQTQAMQMAAEQLIAASGLDPKVQNRLRKRTFDSPEELKEAIEEELEIRNAYADTFAAQTINTRAPITADEMETEHDRLKKAVNWMFGIEQHVPDDYNMRRMDWVWATYTGDRDFNGIFNPDLARETFIAKPSTLPNLVLDAMQKVIVERMRELTHYRWWEKLVVATPNDGTLHDPKFISYGGMSYLPEVADTAAYTELSMADQKETAAFVKRGGYVGISRAMIKNSDVNQMRAVPVALARAAVLTRSAKVAELFTMNSGVGPTMSDNKAWFHADHGGNVQTTALGTDGVALKAAKLECFKMTNLGDGAMMGLWPKYLLVPVDLWDTARILIGAGDGQPTSYNTTAQAYENDAIIEPVVVPNWTDATDWAYMVDPKMQPIIHISYSQLPGGGGHPAPELFVASDPNSGLLFSNDMLAIKVRDEFALGVSDWRGVGKRNVA